MTQIFPVKHVHFLTSEVNPWGIPHLTPDQQNNKHLQSFLAGKTMKPIQSKIAVTAWMVTAVFILSNSATPLYVHWQRQFAFSSTAMTVIFSAYIGGLIAALLVAGQLSDRFGRRAVLAPGFLLAILACVLFSTAASVPALVAARFLTGLGVGIGVSAGMAAVVEAGGPERKRQASQAASMAMVLGAGLGPLLAGTLAQLMADPAPTIFITELLLLATALAVALRLPKSPAAAGKLVWRLPSVQQKHRQDLLSGIAVFAPGITATSFVLSLGPSLLSRLLHVSSPLIAGGTACLMFMSATGVQLLVKHLPIRTILLLGAAATVLSMMAMTTAIQLGAPIPLLLAAVLAGMGQGMGQLGGLSAIGMRVPDAQRAQAISLLNIGAYIPAGLLPVASGFLIDRIGMAAGATAFAAALTAGGAAAAYFVATRQPR
jgi:MFS family permease